MIKVAFFDIDGTMIKLGAKNPSEKMVYTLKQLQKKGILLCMATGRGYTTIPHFDGVDFDIYLTFNGSYIVNKDSIIRDNPLDKNDVQCIKANLAKMNRPFAISSEKTLVTNGKERDLLDYFMMGDDGLPIADNFDELCKENVYQIMVGARKHEYDDILKGTTCAQIVAWWDRAVDIIPANGGKGIAVEKVLEFYNFSKEEAIGFGDGNNDIEMLKSVGTSVAMGNGSDELKAVAQIVCDTVDNDGIYQYCLKEGLIEPFKE